MEKNFISPSSLTLRSHVTESMEAIVLYPAPAVGHLISMVELGKLLLSHHPSLSIHILIFTPPYNAGSTASYIQKVSTTIPSIIFHHLPTITLPPSSTNSSCHHETLMFEVIRLNNPNVHQALISMSNDYTISAFVLDFFCYSALSVTAKLDLPTYLFYTCAAACLITFLYLPTMHNNTTKSLKDISSLLHFPGLPPIPATDMPKPILEREDKVYECFLDCTIQCSKSAGIIVNTFDSLEPRALKAISDGLCVPDGPTPPVYCIGPLIVTDDRGGSTDGGDNDHLLECLTWLNSQPSQSVVFLCFGSLGLFSAEQLKEIAIGLERSGQRFLWVVRNPPSESGSLALSAQADPDLDMLLPEGFSERTKERGLVVKSWAPQVAVLNHDAVGGFVTHCGWNSVLEAVCAGVPMVAWPLYAEQRLNRIFMVEEMKITLPVMESENGFVSSSEVEKPVRELMESEEGKRVRKRTMTMQNEAKNALTQGGSSENGFVSSSEVEKPVRELMESEEGKRVRKRTMTMQNEAKNALTQGGSSRVALAKLVESWKRN